MLYRLILLSTVIFAISCKRGENTGIYNEKICTELYTDSGIIESKIPKDEAFSITGVAPHTSLWRHSKEFPIFLYVEFLNGTEFQKRKVMQYAVQWEEASAIGGFDNKHKIRIRFLNYGSTSTARGNIRILFAAGGSSSYIGSDAERVPQDQPTMFFGWINPAESEESIKSVVLHEFGHAMGLGHEHQHPKAKIPWDKEKVYDYYSKTQTPPWDRAKVDQNIFLKYSEGNTNYSAYDINSIMHYAIPASLTTDGSSISWTSNLSVIDKEFIKKIYLYEECVYNETCCYDRNGKRVLCP